jgi:hypothetical protein
MRVRGREAEAPSNANAGWDRDGLVEVAAAAAVVA